VQVTGVYDGASVELHGTLDDDANYGLLSDQSGLDLRFTAGLRTRFITEATVHIKPVLIGGGALTNLKILIFGRGQVV
jgi:hypothetical protein